MNTNTWRIGKSYIEMYGKKKASMIKEKQSNNARIRYSNKLNHPSFNKTRSDETKEKLRLTKMGDLNPAKRIDVRKKMSLHCHSRKWKGKTYEEIFGTIKAKEIKQKQSIRKNGKKCTAKVIAAMRERMILHPTRKFCNTIIEQKTATELERRGFVRDEDFFQNFGIKGIKNVDFYLSKLNTVIECDGCYYHACHQCGFTKYHQDMIDSDIQNTILLEMSGYRLYRLWEHDINESIEKSINKII